MTKKILTGLCWAFVLVSAAVGVFYGLWYLMAPSAAGVAALAADFYSDLMEAAAETEADEG